jgi:hypothetical protein
MTGAEHDDDGFLEDVVDEILGEDLPPHKAEDPWERRQRVVEGTTAVILSGAAVRTAWTTFPSRSTSYPMPLAPTSSRRRPRIS